MVDLFRGTKTTVLATWSLRCKIAHYGDLLQPQFDNAVARLDAFRQGLKEEESAKRLLSRFDDRSATFEVVKKDPATWGGQNSPLKWLKKNTHF